MTTSLPDQSKNETKKIVSTDQAPAAIGPYSQAVIHGGLVYCSGQIALDPVTMEIVGEDAETQAKQVMNNLGEVLSAAGSDFTKVIKCSIFLDVVICHCLVDNRKESQRSLILRFLYAGIPSTKPPA